MIRIGIVGIGAMGAGHANQIVSGAIPGAELAAVCDADIKRLEAFPDTVHFTDHKKMFESGMIDAVMIATPHYFHTPLSLDAIHAGIHLLVDKPLGVHKADCEKTIKAYETRGRQDLVFAVMFNQRTRPIYRKLKNLIDKGELGSIRRINWTITDWFRSEFYFKAGGWRATWKGEGGGVLLNQCPHQLDLMQWLFGMPSRVRSFGTLGKYHEIEVEDEVTSYLEFPDGATGVFIASTGEAPGTNRLEIAAERGRLIIENDEITWMRNEIPTAEFSSSTTERFAKPPVWEVRVPVEETTIQEHAAVIRAFVKAVSGEGDLIAEGTEGIRSVELGNAMLYSMLKDITVKLPLDGAAYESMLNELIENSTFEKKTVDLGIASADEMSESF